MRTARIVLGILAFLLLVLPLVLFLVALVVFGFGSAVAVAAIYMLLWCMILSAIVAGLLFAISRWGLGTVLRRARGLFVFITRIELRMERLASSLGRQAIRPNVWLYARAAWVRAFVGALLRDLRPT